MQGLAWFQRARPSFARSHFDTAASARRAKIRWYIERLRVMRASEVPHRIRERARQTAYRYRVPSAKREEREVGTPQVLRPLLLSLASVPGSALFWQQAAQQLRDGSLTLLGQTGAPAQVC